MERFTLPIRRRDGSGALLTVMDFKPPVRYKKPPPSMDTRYPKLRVEPGSIGQRCARLCAGIRPPLTCALHVTFQILVQTPTIIVHVPGPPVPGAMQLDHVLTEAVGDRRHERDLERSGGDHDLIGRIAAVLQLDLVEIPGPPD